MKDKAFERAMQIKKELSYLEKVEKYLAKCITISIDISQVETIRKPFIETVKGVIAQLEKEYEDL